MNIGIHLFNSSPEYKSQLNSLMRATFGFSFEAWHQQGLWNEDYTCYSIIEDGVMLANASVYRMRMLVSGEDVEIFQLGAVATRRDRCGEGFSRKIIEMILEQHPQKPFFLFANADVRDFYPRFGFRLIPDRQPCKPVRLDKARGGMKKLSIGEPAVREYLGGRVCFSQVLDCLNAAPVNWFNLNLDYRDCIYEIPDLQTLLVARQDGSTLTLIDLVAKRSFSFEDLLSHLDFEGIQFIRFGFNPDWLGIKYEMMDYPGDSPIFVMGDFDFPDDCVIPWLVRT
jgi:hypothetical protein